MRGGRLTYIAAALVVLVAAGAGAFVATRGDRDDDPPGRPTAGEGEWVQVVGGGDVPLRAAQDEPLPATDVLLGRDVATMAVADDGTLWLVDRLGDLYRVSRDGMVIHQGFFFRFDEAAAAEIGPEGELYIAHHNGSQHNEVTRLDLHNFEGSDAQLEGLGESVVRGMTIAPDGQVYVANSFGAVYQVDTTFGPPEHAADAAAIEGTPPVAPDCPARRSGSVDDENLIGLAVADSGEVLVADPLCPTTYQPGTTVGSPIEAEICRDGTPAPGRVLTHGSETLVVGHLCRALWTVDPNGTTDVLIEGDPTSSSEVTAAGVDADDTMYVLDGDGIWSARLRPRG